MTIPKLAFLDRFFNPRRYWERRASMLPRRTGWFVGRTDMHSYIITSRGNEYVHYAYPPDDGPRVGFKGSPAAALRKAVLYAEKMNKKACVTCVL